MYVSEWSIYVLCSTKHNSRDIYAYYSLVQKFSLFLYMKYIRTIFLYASMYIIAQIKNKTIKCSRYFMSMILRKMKLRIKF